MKKTKKEEKSVELEKIREEGIKALDHVQEWLKDMEMKK